MKKLGIVRENSSRASVHVASADDTSPHLVIARGDSPESARAGVLPAGSATCTVLFVVITRETP
jgi:hypothetical protein